MHRRNDTVGNCLDVTAPRQPFFLLNEAGDTTSFTAEGGNRVEEILNMITTPVDSSDWSKHWTTVPPIDINTGKSLTVQPDLSWDTPMVIYCIKCRKCGKRYFGKTRCYHIPSYSANALYFLQQ